MGNAHFDTLPEDRREAALGALRSVIGPVPIDAAIPLTEGATTAAVFRIDAGAHRYLLRVEGAPSPLRNPHQYISMRTAADAGIAPRLHYFDEAARVAVTDFIDQQPLRLYPGGPLARAEALGRLLRELQATPVFPYFVDYPAIVARLWAHVCRTGLFAPGVLDPINERLAAIRRVYVWNRADSVSCHNDPVPNNVLFDGRRLWLIDWESAYRNDPLIDVSILSEHLARSPEMEEALLRACLGRLPDEALRERHKLVRALTRLYYAGVFLSFSATISRARSDASFIAPSLAAYEQAFCTGRLKPRTPAAWHVLGKMFLTSFLTGCPTPSFEPLT
ncbi:MAG TPA: phosphotransferase [Bradyrhizobium sp.]|uniref:phosphotransferase n=1 Tax=Bradyrhizobium sp. TaxID=376 RepID=UPI002BF86F57|nr:phosphotransferase [Bradyrhizobium sp.]HLZ04619.1 phosphotransferase [Bradyrhizobium sp.]